MGVFNNKQAYCQGWYWALPSKDLPKKAVKSVVLLGQEIILFRGESGKVFALDPNCPHMGANLKLGKVEGDSLRCGFHGWAYSGYGECLGAPKQNLYQPKALPPKQKCHRVEEKFSMIWYHTDPNSTEALPDFSTHIGKQTQSKTDRIETRYCHPTLILGGGVDEDHFNFVHQGTIAQSGTLQFESKRISPRVISFQNTAKIPVSSLRRKILSWLYQGVLTYKVTYWFGTTALAELGPSFLPMYSIFAYRPTPQGFTEGLNIYVTPFSGWFGRWVMKMTGKVLRKGGGEDTPFQNSMQFKETQWVKESKSLYSFIQYVNEQPSLPFPEYTKS